MSRSKTVSVVCCTLALAPLLIVLVALPALTSPRQRNTVIRDTMPAVAMILSVDIRDGQLVPISSGSGTIVDPNGSVITNHHVLYDASKGKLHDLFVIGLFRAPDQEPELVCAGQPSKGMLKPDVDLALIRCDRDRAGAPWQPENWPALPIRKIHQDDIVPGEQVWVLGYPGIGGSTIHVTAGLVSGWTGETGGAGSRAFMKTDASITHGNSGGTAIDEDGNFIGVPTAFRLTTTKHGETIVASGRVGLIRPLDYAMDLIEQARRGGPGASAKDAPSTTHGVAITSRVVSANDGRAIAGALVIVFKEGITVEQLEGGALEEQVLAWARTDASGDFRLSEMIPRGKRFTVAVIAEGFLPLAETGVLDVAQDAPAELDPWQQITLQPK